MFHFKFCALLLVGTISVSASAENVVDLKGAFEAARANDPIFKKAEATWRAAREDENISRAALLPQLSFGADLARGKVINHGTAMRNHATSFAYSFNLTQNIFDFSKIAALKGAKASVRAAYATYLASEMQLVQRVVTQYFDVLLAKKNLTAAKANSVATRRLFEQARQRYKVGLASKTDFEEARRDYELARSNEIAATNELSSRLEVLGVTTGNRYDDLLPLKAGFPLLLPNPQKMADWVKQAEEHNLNLVAARQMTQAAKDKIWQARSGHLPVVGFGMQFNNNYDSTPGAVGSRTHTRRFGGSFNVNVPILQGGGVIAQSRQAVCGYEAAAAEQERIHREVISNTRQAYLSVISYISKVKADRQAILAAESSLNAIKANYEVGRKTMTDVLNAQTKLYSAQLAYAQDENGYINAAFNLRYLVGNLTIKDIEEVNGWLKVKVSPVVRPEVKK